MALALRAVHRAAADLRRGTPVLLHGPEGKLVVAAAEQLRAAALAHFQAPGEHTADHEEAAVGGYRQSGDAIAARQPEHGHQAVAPCVNELLRTQLRTEVRLDVE